MSDRDPRFLAAVDLIGRTGASSWSVRYCDEETPAVWLCVAEYEGEGMWDAAGARDPLTAALRLCEQLVDGALCVHCGKPTGFDPDADAGILAALDPVVCFYRWDPELRTFRRSCEGAS